MSILVLSVLFSLILSVAGTLLINSALHLVWLPAVFVGALLFFGFWHCPRFFCH